MFYTAQITRANPACFVFLIDQSESMGQPFVGGATKQIKSIAVADAINRLLQNLVLRSAKDDGIRDYFHVAVVGYGKKVRAGLGGKLPFDALLPISRVSENPLRMETRTKTLPVRGGGGAIETTVKSPVWFDAEAEGKTPMCEAMAAAGLIVKEFVDNHPDAFPPIVLNMTDGMPSDGNPQSLARTVRQLSTTDGPALVFNLLLSNELQPPLCYPSDESQLANNCSRLLFRMSSELPPVMATGAAAEGYALKPNARGVVINADPASIVRFLDIGTRVSSLEPPR